MNVKLNGKPYQCDGATTVGELLAKLKLDQSTVIVECNGIVLTRQQFDYQQLQDGDTLELVRLVGGG